MWQVLAAAAVAGSGFLAKHLLNTNTTEPDTKYDKPETKSDDDHHHNNNTESQSPTSELFFRFSSGPGCKGGNGFGSNNLRRKLSGGNRGIRGNVGAGKVDKKCGNGGGEEGFVVDHRKSGKKFGVCLKKRRTGKHATPTCQSCANNDNSIFSWGIGVGMMYMMSAGKAETSRLNMAMDETKKVVQELKSELSKSKLLHDLPVSSSESEVNTTLKTIRGQHIQPALVNSSTNNEGDLPVTDEGECASSVLTEEPLPEALEMGQLEAEFESELQKLPWCAIEASCLEGRISDTFKSEVSTKEFHEPDAENSLSCQFGGVLPSELDKKLCHVLIEQQENQIVELESELQRTNSKLHEKESELQALKECVRRLTEFSLTSASDEETEAQVKEEKSSGGDDEKKMGPDQSKKSVVGMKRAMDFDLYGCHST